jgi:hypothetical protein
MAKTIRIEDSIPQVEVQLSSGRRLKLQRPGFRIRRHIPWAAQRPGWGNATAATNTVLLRAAQGELTEVDLRGLEERDRHRLILGVVRVSGSTNDWRHLYGTSLTLDERFLAAMIWAGWREAREAQARLREMRERLLERAPASLGTTPRMTPGIADIGKQLAAMNSFSRMAKTASLIPTFQSPTLAGIPEIAKVSLPTLGLQPLAAPTLSKAWGSPVASTAALKAEIPWLTSEMRGLWAAKELGGETLMSSYMSGIPSFSKQFEPAVGISSITKQLGFLWGASPAIKQLELALGRNLFAGFNIAELFRGGLTEQFDSMKFGLGGNLWRQTQEMMESLLMAEMARLWGEDPLWFLIGHLDPRKLPALLNASREKVFEAVLDGLERVVRDSTLIEQLITACEGIGFLSSEQRAWLKHGLEHAHQGDWAQAMPPLILGFEGAIFNGAVAAEAIAGREGKKLPAEKVIKAIKLDADLEAFAIRLVFGGSGNALRHGRPENGMRDQALPLIVALIGWLDFTLGTSGTAKLASELEDSLTGALGTSQRELVAP